MNPSHSTGLHARIALSIRAKNRLTSARSSLGGVGAGVMSFLPDASSRSAGLAGASASCGGEGWAHQKGSSFSVVGTFTFASAQPVQQLVQRLIVFMEAPMTQLQLRLLGRIDAPSVVPPSILKTARTYRAAVRLCWALRRAKGLRPIDLGRDHGFTRQHVTDYLNDDDLPTRRSLPPERISDFEDLCGNVAITQWLAQRARLTILEELQAERQAA